MRNERGEIMMKIQETVDEEKRNRIVALKEKASKQIAEYANDKVKYVSFTDGAVEVEVRVLGVRFSNKEEARNFLYNEALRVAEILIENRHNIVFSFPYGARHDFDVGPGAPFPTREGWKDIFEYIEETYGNHYRVLLEDIVILDANVQSKGYVPFSFFFPHIEYNEVVGTRR